MKMAKRLLCTVLCLLVLTMFGCSPARPIESTDEELAVVGTVGEFEVLYEEFRFVALIYRDMLIDTYGADIFDTPESAEKYAEMIRDYTYDNITYNYAILTMCREVGIEADDPVLQKAVEDSITDTVKSVGGTRGKYKKYLKENYLTDHFLRFNTCVDFMQSELFYVYSDDLGLIETDDEKISDIILSDFVRTQHIYVSKNNGKSLEENRKTIEAAYDKLLGGADFMTLVTEYGEDEEMTASGICFPEGYMNSGYESAAFALSVDEYSEIIEDTNGYYIIKRIKQDTAYVLANFYTLKPIYQEYKFLSMIDDIQNTLEFVPNDYLNSIDILDIK
ncbi:MAG: peptidylprolyl isomerase [Clostridia bacterium]|nr:peptidylprolyl isomerase [Clostridia bacterium]